MIFSEAETGSILRIKDELQSHKGCKFIFKLSNGNGLCLSSMNKIKADVSQIYIRCSYMIPEVDKGTEKRERKITISRKAKLNELEVEEV